MDYVSLLATVYLFIGVLTTLLGLVLFRENPGVRLNRVTALMLVFAGVGAVLGASSLMVQRVGSESALLRSSMVANFAYLWEFFFPLLLLFAATFPRERAWLRRIPWGEGLVFLPHTIHFILMFSATMWGGSLGVESVGDRVPVLGVLADLLRILFERFTSWHRQLFSLVNLVYLGVSVRLIAQNLKVEMNPSIRRQLRTILVGIGVALALYLVAMPLNLLFGLKLDARVSSTLLVLALAACSGTIAYAIVRHRFLDARWIVRRTILYALASALLLGVYLQVIRQVGHSLQEALHLPGGVLDWVALVVPLVLFQPIMARLEEIFEGWMLHGGRELRSVLGYLSEGIARTLDFEAIAKSLVRELPETLSTRAAAVLLAAPDPTAPHRVVASQGFSEATLESLAACAYWLPEASPPGNPHMPQDWAGASASSGLSQAGAEACGGRSAPALTFELRHGGERLGFLLVGAKVSGMRTSREEIALLVALASQVAVALRNSILYEENLQKVVLEEELGLARRIQQRFLPSRFPTGLPVEVHGVNLPSKQVGGDYFDFFGLGDGGYAIAIADVSGKGVPAALLASMLQASLRTLMRGGASPGRVVEQMNGLLCESTTPEQFVTLFLGHLDLETMRLTYVNAGHNYPIVVRQGVSEMLLPSELILGIDEQARYPECSVSLGAGDTLLLYTDGVTEARRSDGEEFGEERLAQLLCAPSGACAAGVVQEIRDTVLQFTEPGEPQDDMTLLVLRVMPEASPPPPIRSEATGIPARTPA
jgi:sigma-B regulation protein RsbU (phosphoserine phosphatase)